MSIRHWHTSIRWRLPLSYALIALLAALALGMVLLGTLRGYYEDQELNSLLENAKAISVYVAQANDENVPPEHINAQLDYLAFVSQAQVRVTDIGGAVIADTGAPVTQQFVSAGASAPGTDGAPGNLIWIYSNRMASPSELALPEASESIESRTPEILRVSPALFETAQAIESGNNQPRPLMSNPFNEDVVVGVSSTTFGFDLGTGIGSTRVADHAVSVPLMNSGGVYAGSVELIGGPAFGDEVLDGVSRALFIAALIAVLLAAGAGWLISREITRPVLLLAQATGQMASGDLSARVQLLRRDEFGSLAHSFNNMAARVEDTVSTLRRFVADAAHELQTPLTALHADLELALSEGDDGERNRFTQRALGQVSRLSVLADGLLDLSRIESGTSDAQRQAVDLTALVAEMSEVYASRAEQAGIYFEVELPADPVILQVRETQIRRAVGNLLDNAIKFTPENGAIRLRLKHHAENVEISVNDTGIGIAPDDLPQLFHRFHRGRNAASYPGSGLGLAIIKAIIDGHHGEIFVQSSGTGTQFTIQLPAAA